VKIRSKAEFFRLWRAGVLGNRTLLWDTIAKARAYYPPVQKFGFREIGKAGGGAWELVERDEGILTFVKWRSLRRKFVIDGSVPNDHSTMQGEVCRTERGLESFLAVGYALPPMRRSIAAGMHRSYSYVQTLVLLEKYMDPSSRDDLDALLELYPDATIEFTCFDIDVGVFPGRNTIFWEVRDY